MFKYLCGLLIIIPLCSPSLAFQEINISFRAVENQPYFIGVPEINIDAEEFDTIVLKMKLSKGGNARLFWASPYNPQMSESKSIWFFLDKSNNSKEYIFNLKSQSPYWMGFIGQLLIYLENGPEGIEIESAKAVAGNFLTNVKSGWREFWGPRGRVIIGSTINTMQSPLLFGRPIFVYIYWLFGIALLIYSSYKAYKWAIKEKKDELDLLYLRIGRFAIFSILSFWAMLEISSLYNHGLSFKNDARFIGKSQEEKLVMVNPGDYYPFIQFCRKNLPENAEFDFRIQPTYGDIKARYYLYPRKFKIGAEYLLIYDVKTDDLKGYSLLKKFRENACILKKK